MNYTVVSPVRNEGRYLPMTIESLAAQTIRPTCWVIVDDGSTDETGQICDEAAARHPWIQVVHRENRGYRKAGGGVVDAFYDGYRLIGGEAWEYIVKLDGDLSFNPDFFEKCFDHFRNDCHLGIAGGTICSCVNGILEVESKGDPAFHVRGATKIYRSECWMAIGELIRAPGWDTMDEVKANMLGWRTRTLAGVNVVHHRPTGGAAGAWRDRVKNGVGCYVTGYHPLFMVLKSVRRMVKRPYVVGGLGMLCGYAKGYITGIPQIKEQALKDYFREQQINRLLFRKSLWD